MKKQVKDVCVEAMDMAIEKTMEKCGSRNRQEVLERLRAGDPCSQSYLRYFLVQHVSSCLSSHLKGVKAIYMFGSSLDRDTTTLSLTSDINLIVVLDRVRKEHGSLLEELNQEITAMYRDTFRVECKDCFRLLDLHLIDLKALKKGEGVAALLDSTHDRPIKVWGPAPRRR